MVLSRAQIADELLKNAKYSVNIVPEDFVLLKEIFESTMEKYYGAPRRRGTPLYKAYPLKRLLSLTCGIDRMKEADMVVRECVDEYKKRRGKNSVPKVRIRIVSDMEVLKPEEIIYQPVAAFVVR